MESVLQNVVQPLQLLIYISLVLVLIIGIFLIKLLLDTSNLVNSMQDFVKVTQSELEPAIKEIQLTLTNLNNISSNINTKLDDLNKGLEKGGQILSDSSIKAYGRLKGMGDKIKNGALSILNTLLK